MNTETYTKTIIKRETTEDGDLLLTFEVRAKGFAGVREFHDGENRVLAPWHGCGDGWLRATYYHLVDGAEVAIERSNDAWAQHQQDIEDACVGRGW